MNGWGRVVFSVTVGLALGAGCGGRTGVPFDDGTDIVDPDGGTSGTPSSGGRPGTAGRSTGGSVTTGGRPSPAGGVSSFGGVTTTGGAPFGGFGGAFPMGGFGGSFPFPMGGFGGTGPDDCQSCLYETCGAGVLKCFGDQGCIQIITCMALTGCDTFECYSPETCGPTIDQWGGPFGPSMSLLLDSVSCTLMSGCPCN